MALLWFEGFEGYEISDANIADMIAVKNPVIDYVAQGGTPEAVGTGGRNGGNCFKMSMWQTFHYDSLQYYLKPNYTSFIFGCAVYFDTWPPSVEDSVPLWDFRDSSTSQIKFHPNGSGEIEVQRGDNTTLGTTSDCQLAQYNWRYIEIKFTIDNSVGSVTVRSNTKVVLALTGIDTQQSSNNYINEIVFRCVNGLNIRFDDMYWCDTTGSKNNNFLGDVRIDVLRPSGAGTYTQLTPSAGSNYENVDESPAPDDDTTYNEGQTKGLKDTYAMSDLSTPTGTPIIGVKNQITVRKTDVGGKLCRLLTKVGSTEKLSGYITLGDSYMSPARIYEDNPDDDAAWEDADVNGMEVGLVITSLTYTTTSTT